MNVLVKRPVAFRVPRLFGDQVSHWFVTTSEDEARAMADTNGVEYEGLYVRDGTAIVLSEEEALEAAVDRMGWPEIHAFQNELWKGQDYREDAGGFMMRAIRRLFGLPSPGSEVETYQDAARAMIAKAMAEQAMPKSHS
jgi:hypothetical protein